MWFPLYLQCTLWLVSYKREMVDYQVSLEGWLDDATLFPSEPNDYGFNFDEILLSSEKTNYEADLVTGLPDLGWLDTHTDLSILDEAKDLNLQSIDIEDPLNLGDAANLLLDLLDTSNLDASYLSSDTSKNDFGSILNPLIEGPDVSSEVQPSSSPFYEPISEVGSPASSSDLLVSDGCSSPDYYSLIDGGYESEALSPATTDSSGQDTRVVTVTVCDMDTSDCPASSTLNIEEVVHSVRKRRYVSDGKDIPKVTLKNVFHPYSKAIPKRSGGKKERKKIQNKEAAARYRVKKRIEERELSGEVECLENEQEELRKKHDGLVSEIKYLKNLMKEVLKKKGIM